jgi:hypothetical protein
VEVGETVFMLYLMSSAPVAGAAEILAGIGANFGIVYPRQRPMLRAHIIAGIPPLRWTYASIATATRIAAGIGANIGIATKKNHTKSRGTATTKYIGAHLNASKNSQVYQGPSKSRKNCASLVGAKRIQMDIGVNTRSVKGRKRRMDLTFAKYPRTNMPS